MLRLLFISILIMFSATYTQGKELDYHNLLVMYIVKTGDDSYAKNSEEWMQVFRYDTWSKYRKNEFEFDNKKKEIEKVIQNDIAKYNEKDQFQMLTAVEFGEYDFDAQSFELAPFNSSTVFYIDRPYGETFPRRFSVFFTNYDIIEKLPMEKKAAKAFHDKRTSGSYTNKRLTAQIKASVESVSSDFNVKLHIDEIAILDDKNKNKIIHTVKSNE